MLLWALSSWSYKLPSDYDPNTWPLNVTNNSDGTYNFYFIQFPEIKIYQSKKGDLLAIGVSAESGCTKNLLSADFFYNDHH